MNQRIALDAALARITIEVDEGRKKHGPMLSAHDGFSRLRGEIRELEDEVHADRRPERRAEALQVAAMAVRLAIEEWAHP